MQNTGFIQDSPLYCIAAGLSRALITAAVARPASPACADFELRWATLLVPLESLADRQVPERGSRGH